jgi:hypothetical protein
MSLQFVQMTANLEKLLLLVPNILTVLVFLYKYKHIYTYIYIYMYIYI